MQQDIPYLQEGDLIYITAPAKAIECHLIENATKYFIEKGFRVKVGKHCCDQYNYFSGSLAQRISDFQEGINDPEIKAIICARGGYGSVQIIDHLQWSSFLKEPKWIVGFSDITYFHQKIAKFGLKSIHGTMPLNFEENTSPALDTLLNTLKGNFPEFTIESNQLNKMGKAQGTLIGGNLSIIYANIGTDDQPPYENSIMFIEDLSEQLYHVDRMFNALRKSGILSKIKGLIIGGMTDLKDTIRPFGMTYEEIILSHLKYEKIPVCFDFPAGHIEDNRSLILGQKIEFKVFEEKVQIKYL